MNRFKKWLLENEIYFKTIATILLSIMAIIVSIRSNQIAKSQLEVLTDQKKLTLESNQPQFKFNLKFYDSAGKFIPRNVSAKLNNDKIAILNEGGEINYFHVESMVFSNPELRRGKKYNSVNSKYLITIPNYYRYQNKTLRRKGDLAVLEGVDNLKYLTKFHDDVRNNNEFEYSIESLNLLRFIKISYQDLFGKDHTVYFYINFDYGKKISTELGEKLFKEGKKASLTHCIDLESYWKDTALYKQMQKNGRHRLLKAIQPRKSLFMKKDSLSIKTILSDKKTNFSLDINVITGRNDSLHHQN